MEDEDDVSEGDSEDDGEQKGKRRDKKSRNKEAERRKEEKKLREREVKLCTIISILIKILFVHYDVQFSVLLLF